MAPRVNILIANYNYDEWLRGCVESAATQDYKNLAITVVDSASTDNSWATLLSLVDNAEIQHATKDSPFELIRGTINSIPFLTIRLPEALGPSYARNVGIEATLSETDIYAILDADDEYYPNKVSRCVAELAQTSMIGAVYADYDTLNTETDELTREYKEPFSRERLLRSCIVHSGALVTKEALLASKDEFGFYDNNMRTCEDYDLWMRISEKFMITHVPEALSLVRVQPRNSTRTVDNSVWQANWARIRGKLQNRRTQ